MRFVLWGMGTIGFICFLVAIDIAFNFGILALFFEDKNLALTLENSIPVSFNKLSLVGSAFAILAALFSLISFVVVALTLQTQNIALQNQEKNLHATLDELRRSTSAQIEAAEAAGRQQLDKIRVLFEQIEGEKGRSVRDIAYVAQSIWFTYPNYSSNLTKVVHTSISLEQLIDEYDSYQADNQWWKHRRNSPRDDKGASKLIAQLEESDPFFLPTHFERQAIFTLCYWYSTLYDLYFLELSSLAQKWQRVQHNKRSELIDHEEYRNTCIYLNTVSSSLLSGHNLYFEYWRGFLLSVCRQYEQDQLTNSQINIPEFVEKIKRLDILVCKNVFNHREHSYFEKFQDLNGSSLENLNIYSQKHRKENSSQIKTLTQILTFLKEIEKESNMTSKD